MSQLSSQALTTPFQIGLELVLMLARILSHDFPGLSPCVRTGSQYIHHLNSPSRSNTLGLNNYGNANGPNTHGNSSQAPSELLSIIGKGNNQGPLGGLGGLSQAYNQAQHQQQAGSVQSNAGGSQASTQVPWLTFSISTHLKEGSHRKYWPKDSNSCGNWSLAWNLPSSTQCLCFNGSFSSLKYNASLSLQKAWKVSASMLYLPRQKSGEAWRKHRSSPGVLSWLYKCWLYKSCHIVFLGQFIIWDLIWQEPIMQ